MTINIADNSPRISYAVAQGATQTSFAVPFEFFDNADLNVFVDGTLKTITTHYTVSGGDGSTGTVSISVTGITGGSTVVITRDIALERTTDFPVSGAFNIVALNTELDRIVAIAADLEDQSNRALQLTDFDAAVSLVLPDVDTRKGKTLAFNASTGAVEAGPSITDVQTVSAASADIALLANIQDGTTATNAITTVASNNTNINTVAGISSNITTVAGNNSNVTAVAGISSNVTTVAGKASEITTVASKASLLTSDFISDLNTLTTDVIADLNTLATSSIVADLDALAASGVLANIATLSASDVVADMALLGTSDAVSDMNTLASSANVTAMNTLGTSANVTAMSNVSGAIANVNTVATNLSGVNSFAERYRVASSDPSSSLDEGDLAYNSTSNVLKYYNGSAWISLSAGLASLAADTTPQLGGNLDMNGQDIVTTSNADIDLAPNGTGRVVVKGNTNQGSIVLNCENNSHGITIQSAPHSASATYTVKLPNALGLTSASAFVTSDANGVVGFDNGTTEESTVVTSSSNAATINLRDGNVFTHTLSENVTYTFSNPAANGRASAFILKVVQDSSARAITWPTSVDWAAATAPTITATSAGVDVFAFITVDGGTNYYGFTLGQAMG